jgi:hypothetical protein
MLARLAGFWRGRRTPVLVTAGASVETKLVEITEFCGFDTLFTSL